MADLTTLIDKLDLFHPLTPEQFDYYLRLWGYLEIEQLEPRTDATTTDSTQTIYVDIEDGWLLQYNPGHINVSVGDNERTFSTKKLLEAAKISVQILQQAGAKKVALAGLDIAKLAAWLECQQLNIEVPDFNVSLFNTQLQRIKKIRKLNIHTDVAPQP